MGVEIGVGVGFSRDGVIPSPDSFIVSVLMGLDDDVIVRLVDDVIVGLVDDVIVDDNIRSSSSSSSFRLSGFNSDDEEEETDKKLLIKPEPKKSLNLGLFMMKWSNRFVFISLLLISAIALTKQAWA